MEVPPSPQETATSTLVWAAPCLEGRGTLDPLSPRVPCLSAAPLFLKATSVHVGKLQIVYMGNVSCPHLKIYTSLRPKCLRLEIERQSPGLTFVR